MNRSAFALLALLAGCASTPDVKTDHDPSVDFSRFHTYYWAQPPNASNPLAGQRIVAGVDARLAARGWQRQEGSGDIALVANVATSEKQTLDTFYTGSGMGTWGWGPGWGAYGGMGTSTTRVNTYMVGTLVLDMFDTSTKKAVWRGTGSGTVPDSPQKTEAAINAGLDKMFAAFPPGAAPKK
jgi:hypothetical protein